MHYVLPDGTQVPKELMLAFNEAGAAIHIAGIRVRHDLPASYEGIYEISLLLLDADLRSDQVQSALWALQGYQSVAEHHKIPSSFCEICRFYGAADEAKKDPTYGRSGLAADLIAVLTA